MEMTILTQLEFQLKYAAGTPAGQRVKVLESGNVHRTRTALDGNEHIDTDGIPTENAVGIPT